MEKGSHLIVNSICPDFVEIHKYIKDQKFMYQNMNTDYYYMDSQVSYMVDVHFFRFQPK